MFNVELVYDLHNFSNNFNIKNAMYLVALETRT